MIMMIMSDQGNDQDHPIQDLIIIGTVRVIAPDPDRVIVIEVDQVDDIGDNFQSTVDLIH